MRFLYKTDQNPLVVRTPPHWPRRLDRILQSPARFVLPSATALQRNNGKVILISTLSQTSPFRARLRLFGHSCVQAVVQQLDIHIPVVASNY
jgi:hypothetical protein